MTKRKWPGCIRIGVACLVAVSALTLAPRSSHAEQFVLFDVTFTYTKMEADTSSPSRSHFYVMDGNGRLNRNRPTNWVTPVDYRNGTVHIRTEVIDKPVGSEITQWTLCYIPNVGVPGGGGYGCTGSGTYREEGVYEQDVSMTSWWQNTAIDYTMGIRQMDLVMKDSNGGSGFTNLRPDPEHFFPTTMRITMVQVSAGSTYNAAMIPGLDGGASTDAAPARDAATVADARTGGGTPDAAIGGSGGQAGSGGAAGSAGAGGQAGQGTAGVGGTPGSGTGGAGGSAGTTGPGKTVTSSGCSCALTARNPRSGGLTCAALVALSALGLRRRRRARKSR